MFDVLFDRLKVLTCIIAVGVVSWLVRTFAVAWRDINGNGVIDEDE